MNDRAAPRNIMTKSEDVAVVYHSERTHLFQTWSATELNEVTFSEFDYREPRRPRTGLGACCITGADVILRANVGDQNLASS